MMCIKIALLFILIFCIAVPAFGADTVRTYDTVVHYDTTYLYDTTIAIQKQLTEMKSEFYDRAMQSIDHKRSNVNIMLVIIGIFMAVISIVVAYMTYLHQQSRKAVDKEMDKVVEDRREVSKILRDVTSKREQIMDMVDSVGDVARKAVAPLQTEEAKEKRLSPEERIKLIEKADAEESIEEYEKLLLAMEFEGIFKDKLPTSLHKNVGLNYYRLDRYEKAVEEFLLYLHDFPNDEDCLFSAAYCFGELKNHDRAVEFYTRVTKLDPRDDIAYVNWAGELTELYDKRNDVSLLEEAIDKCKKAVEINDKNDDAYNNWGATLSKLYDERKVVSLLEEAIDKFKRAVEIDDQNDDAFVGWGAALGDLYNERKEASLSEEAIGKFKKAIEINDLNYDAYYNWGVTLSKLYDERKDASLLVEEIDKYKKAVEINDKHDSAYYNLACAESLLENKPEMLRALRKAIELDAGNKKTAREDEDKDFEKYWDDPDFIALTKED